MAYELTINIGKKATKLFLQEGFYALNVLSKNLHQHNYTEFHCISGGKAQYMIGNHLYCFQDGDIIAIPKNTLHMCLSATENLLHTAFLSDAAVPLFATHRIQPSLMRSFMDEIQRCNKASDHIKVSAFIELICCDFYPDHIILPKPSQDFGFIIQEFISRNYRENVKLSDLAEILHFSEKHTARLVLSYTGCTFRQAITNQRMAVARHLTKTTDMTLQEISQYLGYQTYSGFWKAYRKNTGF